MLAGLLVLPACSSHLDAVRVVGAVGETLSAQEPVLGSIPATCLEVATLSGASDECADLRAQARSWERVVGLVDAYARGLRSATGERTGGAVLGVALADVDGEPWVGLSPGQVEAARTVAGAVRAMLLRAPTEDELRATIQSSDGAIQELSRGLTILIGHELERIELARTSVDVIREHLQQLATAAPPARRSPTPPAPAPVVEGRPHDKTSAAVAAELEPVRHALAALQERLDGALAERTADRVVDRQASVPGALAELGVLQNDLESKRGRLARLRDDAALLARAHKALRDNLGRAEPDAVLSAVLRGISQSAPQSPSAPTPGAR